MGLEVAVRWVERVNGNGLRFLQWQQTYAKEPSPPWGPGEALAYCPCCGEEYAQRHMDVNGEWHSSVREYVYHDPVRHRDWPGVRSDGERVVTEVKVPREVGE